MAIIRIGVDLAKNVFAVHGVDEAGKVVLARTVRREQLLEVLAAVAPCIVAMQACSGAHHWARQLAALGHTPRIIAPKFVSPYRMSGRQGKNDAQDAAAICEAAGRPAMRFVPMNEDLQARLRGTDGPARRAHRDAPVAGGLRTLQHRASALRA
jgi:transposase